MLVCVQDMYVWIKMNDRQFIPRAGYFRSQPARPSPGELGNRRSWAPVKWHAASEKASSHSTSRTATASNNQQATSSGS